MKFMEAAKTFPAGETPRVRRKNWNPHARVRLDDASAISGGEWAIGPWAHVEDITMGICGGSPATMGVISVDDGTDEWEPFVLEEGERICVHCKRRCGGSQPGCLSTFILVGSEEQVVCADSECRETMRSQA